MENHVKILGVLYIIGGALGLLVALIFVVVFGLGALGLAGVAVHEDPEAALAIPIIGAIGTFLVVVIVILSIPSIAAGFGLMKYWPWARILTIVLSALNLPSVPLWDGARHLRTLGAPEQRDRTVVRCTGSDCTPAPAAAWAAVTSLPPPPCFPNAYFPAR